jgi:hypothetical protein
LLEPKKSKTMEPKSNTMLKSAMTSGLILGIALVVYSLTLYIIGMIKPPAWVGIINYLLIIGGIIYGTKKYRDEDLGGEISYSQALGFGVLVCVFAALISGVYTILLMTVIDPEYISKLMSIMEEEFVQKGLPEEQIDAAMKMLNWMRSPIFMTLSTIIGFAFMGTIFSLVTSAFLKKEKPIFDNPTQPKQE